MTRIDYAILTRPYTRAIIDYKNKINNVFTLTTENNVDNA